MGIPYYSNFLLSPDSDARRGVAEGLSALGAPQWVSSPRGSEYPNSKALGPQIQTLNGFGALKPYYLGTWT